ncbi:MAG: hypothetical protein OXI92_05140, partial [Acidobacteriota bacterium]|nr:hypothetical protein [Acidobacteriota bacterium]
MQMLERATWCLTAVLLMFPASWAQGRGAGREAAARRTMGAMQAMQDRLRAIRLSRSNLNQSVLQLRSHL